MLANSLQMKKELRFLIRNSLIISVGVVGLFMSL
jgi:hypothetical protein